MNTMKALICLLNGKGCRRITKEEDQFYDDTSSKKAGISRKDGKALEHIPLQPGNTSHNSEKEHKYNKFLAWTKMDREINERYAMIFGAPILPIECNSSLPGHSETKSVQYTIKTDTHEFCNHLGTDQRDKITVESLWHVPKHI
ncbi:hypothetical protein LOAG_02213 [Loa loa]|uniref:Uncharacterized protein n=1 Tax=Loa loa TaxID=7209 RepID=A0A1S0U7F1_LOALO|nr:hypothetical protein LOAG_02213 [Loa loa]EFO26268.1 hypothetical protein LOAG_02213 [Loa loa]